MAGIDSPPRLARTAFRTSRLLDFASQKELTAQIGHPPSDWPLVIVKELVDNALDACEEASGSNLTNDSLWVRVVRVSADARRYHR
jgi:hypothetical protein